MRVETAACSHQGGREEQQDACATLIGGDEHLLVVADGMGGHAGGRIASAKVVETARRLWQLHQAKPLEPRRLLEAVMRESHAAINAAGVAAGLTPRSTAAVLHLGPARAHWAHVGDSRIYRFRGGTLKERTRDHSVVQMLVDLGKVAEEDMGRHPDQNRLTQSLGGDVVPMPDFGVEDLRHGDSFVLCSDGLWEVIAPDEMKEALGEPTMENALCEALAARAFQRAGPRSDNITLVLARVQGDAALEAPTVRTSTRRSESGNGAGGSSTRFQDDALDARRRAAALEAPTVPLAASRSAPTRTARRYRAASAAVLAVLVAGGALAVYRSLEPPVPAVTKSTPQPPPSPPAPELKPSLPSAPPPAPEAKPSLPRGDQPSQPERGSPTPQPQVTKPDPGSGSRIPKPSAPPHPERRGTVVPEGPPSPALKQPGTLPAPSERGGAAAPDSLPAAPEQPGTTPGPDGRSETPPDPLQRPPSDQAPAPPRTPDDPAAPQR